MRIRIHHSLFAAFIGVVGLLVLFAALAVGSGLRRALIAVFEAEPGCECAQSLEVFTAELARLPLPSDPAADRDAQSHDAQPMEARS